MTDFEVKESGWYETRDGKEAEVVINTGSRSRQPVVGYIVGNSFMDVWCLNGRYYLNNQSGGDLVKYLGKERKKTVKMAPALHRHGEGGWVTNTLYRSEQDAKDDSQRDRFIRWLIDTPYAIEVEVKG